jgi:hypothetical protein
MILAPWWQSCTTFHGVDLLTLIHKLDRFRAMKGRVYNYKTTLPEIMGSNTTHNKRQSL